MTGLDLLVVGGGPVGLATSLYAARAGLSVHVLDPRPSPVDKACGEGLMPGGLGALLSLGIDPPGRHFLGIRYVGAGAEAGARFTDGPGRGVRRTCLHELLTDAVDRAGVPVSGLTAVALHQHGDGVRVETTGPRGVEGARFDARYVVAADGLHSWTRRHLGLDRPVGGPGRYGLRRHFAVAPWSDHVEVHWGPHAEAYVTPVGDDLVGVAVLSSRRVPYDEHLATFPLLRDRLRGAEVTPVQGAGPLRQRSRRRVDGRVLLVGDASGYVDALTGEGISLGLAHGRAAVRALVSGSPTDYERSWRRETWRATLLTQLLRQSTRPGWGRRAVVPAAARLPGIFSAAVNELGRAA